VNPVLLFPCFLTCAVVADDRIDNSVDVLSEAHNSAVHIGKIGKHPAEGGHLMRRQDPVQKGQKITPHSTEDALLDDLDELDEEQNDSDDKAPEFFEGNISHADPPLVEKKGLLSDSEWRIAEKVRVYESESDVQRECSKSSDCFGYWRKTTDNSVDNSGSCTDCVDEFRMLEAGHHYWSVGKPNDSVKSVMVKKVKSKPLSCDNECQIGECTGGCNRRRSDGCCMSRRRSAGRVHGKCKDAFGTPTCFVVDAEPDPNPIPSF